MDIVGISKDEQTNILYLVAAILHLGNLTFKEGGKGNAAVGDPQILQTAAYYLSVEPGTLQNALLFRVIQVFIPLHNEVPQSLMLLKTGGTGQSSRSSTYNVPANPEQATNPSDSLELIKAERHMEQKMHWQEKSTTDYLTGLLAKSIWLFRSTRMNSVLWLEFWTFSVLVL